MSLVLIGGGSRSGKTRFALDRARSLGSRRAFLATAQALDEEMRERIRLHREERGAEFDTFEEPYATATFFNERSAKFEVVVLDCLTLWISNLLLSQRYSIRDETTRLLKAIGSAAPHVIAVTNEVGCGVVPDSTLGREFRDHAGWTNQRFAEQASEVYFMAFGLAIRMK